MDAEDAFYGSSHDVPVSSISFDDMSSTREDFLLMLVSSSSGSVAQRMNQKRALTMLHACGVEPEFLDAAEPANATVRDELCEMSGMRGNYPQFFLVQGDQTTFFADFAELELMNEEGTLSEWLGMEIPCSPPAQQQLQQPQQEVETVVKRTTQQQQQQQQQKHQNHKGFQDHFNESHSVVKECIHVDDQETVETQPETSHGGSHSTADSISFTVPHGQHDDGGFESRTVSLERSETSEHEWSENIPPSGRENIVYSPYNNSINNSNNKNEYNHQKKENLNNQKLNELPRYPNNRISMRQVETPTLPSRGENQERQQAEIGAICSRNSVASRAQFFESKAHSPKMQEHHPRQRSTSSQRQQARSSPAHSLTEDRAIECQPHRQRQSSPSSWEQQTRSSLSHSPKENYAIYSDSGMQTTDRKPKHRQQQEQEGEQCSLHLEYDSQAAPEDENSEFNNVKEGGNVHQAKGCEEIDDGVVDDMNGIRSLSLLSSDESVDTTATSSSIVTNSRMTAMDLDLRIEPSTDIHFLLKHSSEDTSHCTVTLTNMSPSYLPLAFKIQASQRRRYMVWPSAGVIEPQTSTSITVFLVDDAKQELLDLFEKFGPAAEFRQKDTLSIEWCGVPTDFCTQLTGDDDQDMETLWSYWNLCQKDEGWTPEQSFLRVRVSVDDRDNGQCHAIPRTPTSPTNRSCNISPNVSMDTTNSSLPSDQFLQAELENLRRKCQELTAERYLLEQQLEEARTSSPDGGAVHKSHLQQSMRCGRCSKIFQSAASSPMAPIASRSCGHSICRKCCRRISSRTRRSPRHSLSSDLLMCVGDMQSTSFDDGSCPICFTPDAFGGSKLHVNHSLCLVLKLLDS